jgi:hypothetical protein
MTERKARARTGESRFLPFDYAQGRNDRQKNNDKMKSKD